MASLTLPIRPRRNRQTEGIRRLVRQTEVRPSDLALPLFVVEGAGVRDPIAAMPGRHRLSIDTLIAEAGQAFAAGVPAVALFPAIADDRKDPRAGEAMNPDGLVPQAVRALKHAHPHLLVITDVAMDPYSSDGHDGLVIAGRIDNDQTLPILADMALCQAEAGADLVAPSDMMDGRIGYIRDALDRAGHLEVGILAYSAKYASCFYGPFREALDSAPRAGDKKTYQVDPANRRDALREVRLDVAEGADIVMVKPALPYLDVLAAVRAAVDVPVAAYQVSGEYAMIEAAAAAGWIDRDRAMAESITAIKRAGADIVLTYFATEMARRCRDGAVRAPRDG